MAGASSDGPLNGALRPGRPADGGAVRATRDAVGDQVPPFSSKPKRPSRPAPGILDLLRHPVLHGLGAAGEVPDARLFHRAGEEAGRGAAARERAADGRALMLVDLGVEAARQRQRAVEDAVEVQAPGVVGRVVVIAAAVPDVAGHRRDADTGVVRAVGGVLEVGDQHAAGRVDPEEVVHVQVGWVSASARPFVISGIALAMPVPVLVPALVPVRLNYSSSVKLWAFSVGAAPKVTYWLDLFSCRPRPAEKWKPRRGLVRGGRAVGRGVHGHDRVVVRRRTADGRRVDQGEASSRVTSAVPPRGGVLAGRV